MDSRLGIIVLLAAVASCQASVKVKAKTSTDLSADDGAREGTDQVDDSAAFEDLDSRKLNAAPALKVRETEPALLGARHDLYLQPEEGTQCACLRAAVGHPESSAFGWDSSLPNTDANTQMVIAFTSHHQSCGDAPEGSLGAAYRGYQARGNDIVVLVEQARPGKPRIEGAIIPRPGPDGKVLIQPYPASLPYGKASDSDDDPCVVQPPREQMPPGMSPAELEEGGGDRQTKTLGENSSQREKSPQQAQKRDFTVVDVQRSGPVQPSFEDISAPEEFKQDTRVSDRDGAYLSIALGGAYSYLTSTQGGTVTVTGVAPAFDFLIGGALSPGTVAGVLIGGAATPDPVVSWTGEGEPLARALLGNSASLANGTSMAGVWSNAVHIGAFGDTYFGSDSGLHAAAQLAYMRGTLSAGGPDSGSLNGLELGLGVGYDFWLAKHWSLGALARGSYSLLTSANTDALVSLILPSLSLQLIYH